MEKTLFAFFILGLCLTLARAEADCSKEPNLGLVMFKCCKTRRPNLESFAEECPKPEAKGNLATRRNLCHLGCLFNASQALDGIALNLPNVKVMMGKLQPDPEVAEAYYKAFEECGPLVHNKIEEFQAKNEGRGKGKGGKEQCPPHAFIYSVCAQSRLIKYCPASAWQENERCTEAKEFMENCAEAETMPKRKGGGRKNKGKGGKKPQEEVEEEE